MQLSERNQDGLLISSKTPYFEEPEAERGGAGMYSTVEDYMRILGDTLKESPVTLNEDTMNMLFTPQFAEGSKLQKSIWDIVCMQLVGNSMEGVTANQALGGFVNTHDIVRDDFFKPKGTLGWHGIANLCWNSNREKGLAFFFATQILPYGDEKSVELMKEFEAAVWKTYGDVKQA